jgi:hypothetical protein
MPWLPSLRVAFCGNGLYISPRYLPAGNADAEPFCAWLRFRRMAAGIGPRCIVTSFRATRRPDMQKPAPVYTLDFVFHPEHDAAYRHFENASG